jgi:hypothetical protein
MKKFILLILLFSCVFTISAQEENKKKQLRNNAFLICPEVFFGGMFNDLNEKWEIRQDIESQWNDYHNNYGSSVYSNTFYNYAGIRTEYRFLNSRMGLISGLRFTTFSNKMEKDSFFHLRYICNNTGTEFARVKKIREINNYIGIPLELRLIPFQSKYVALSVKIGAEFNYRVNEDLSIDFVNDNMQSMEEEIINNIGVETKDFYSTLYCSLGIRLITENRVSLNMEIVLPSYIITSNNFSTIIPKTYNGFLISCQIPLIKNS